MIQIKSNQIKLNQIKSKTNVGKFNGEIIMSYAIVCGSINMDLICTTPRIPLPGETIIGWEYHTKEGGKGANQATAISRIGLSTKMIGCVGRDSFGSSLLLSLKANNVDTSNIMYTDCNTGTAHITVEDSGENNIVVIPSANARLLPEHVFSCEDLIAGAAVAVTQFEIPQITAMAFLRSAKKYGVFTVLNPSPLPKEGISEEILSQVDLLVLNETEMKMLTEVFVEDASSFEIAAKNLHNKGVQQVVCTLGIKGSYYSSSGRQYYQRAFQVNTIDTTCAGDSFTGALILRLIEGSGPEAAMLFAAKAAALTVTKLGAQESLPTLEEIESAIW